MSELPIQVHIVYRATQAEPYQFIAAFEDPTEAYNYARENVGPISIGVMTIGLVRKQEST